LLSNAPTGIAYTLSLAALMPPFYDEVLGTVNAAPTYESRLNRKYLPELDGLRAISVLFVVSQHMHDRVWGWLAGGLGVVVFFVLSGYLITTLALREESHRGSVSLAAFYIRRSFRIFPLYYVILMAYCILIFVLHIDYDRKAPTLRGAMPWYLLYMQEVPFFYGLVDGDGVMQRVNIPLYQSWSLGIEEKFYLVWPLLAFALWRGKRATRVVGTIGLTLAFGLVPIVAQGPFGSCLFPYYYITIGCLCALLLQNRLSREYLRPLGNGIWVYLALMFVLVVHFLHPWLRLFRSGDARLLTYSADVVYALAVALFLMSVVLGDGVVQRALRWPPLVFIGKMSYGIYLVHLLTLNVAEKAVNRLWPPQDPSPTLNVASVVALMLACIFSVIAAYVLHRVIEKPCIEFGRRWSKRIMDQGTTQPIQLAVGAERSVSRPERPEVPAGKM